MNILEKEIEDLLFDGLTTRPDILSKRGFNHRQEKTYLRQPNLGNYGIPDIVGYTIGKRIPGYRFISVSIHELKKEEINTGTLLQAARYATGIKEYVEHIGIENASVDISISLVGKSIDLKSDFVYLLNLLRYSVTAYTFSLDIEAGLKFKKSYWVSQNQ